MWSFIRRSCISCYWRPEIRVNVGMAKLWLAVFYPLLELTLFLECSLFHISLRKEESLLAGVQKYKLQNCTASATKKKKKKNTSKHSRHLNNTHTITLDCLPNINKENAWDLSASVSQLSWSTKSGDGMEWDGICTVATVHGLCQTLSHLLQ